MGKYTEQELRAIVRECVAECLMENPLLTEGWFGDTMREVGNGVKNTAGQYWNRMQTNRYGSKANDMARKVRQQIELSQQVINREQDKITKLRNQYNAFVGKAQNANTAANNYRAQRGLNSNGDYTYNGTRDNRTQDFYNDYEYQSHGWDNYNRGEGAGYERGKVDGNAEGYNTGHAAGYQAGEAHGRKSERGKYGVQAKKKKRAQAQAPTNANPQVQTPTADPKLTTQAANNQVQARKRKAQ